MDRQRAFGELHPGPVELEQYLRGRLAPGHAAAILAHAVACRPCARRLARAARKAEARPSPAPEPRVEARSGG